MTGEALLKVAVANASGEDGVPGDVIAGLLDLAYRSKRKKPACLDLLVTSDAEMARMNLRHLGVDGPTDVLAFDDGEEEDGRLRLGDIAISADTAKRVAAERGVPFAHELAFYALHGLLHLLGMMDDDDEDRAAMLKAQLRIMREYGLDADEVLSDF